MKPNVGKTDRIVRALLGIALLGLAAYQRNLWSLLWGFLGICLLLSAASGLCFGYRACGLSTCRVEPPAGGPPNA